jgi:hypothetical protein
MKNTNWNTVSNKYLKATEICSGIPTICIKTFNTFPTVFLVELGYGTFYSRNKKVDFTLTSNFY